MRTLISTAFVSLDGVVDSPGGGPTEPHRSGGWTFKDIEFLEEAYELKGREQQEATAMMMGRHSYEVFAPVWPTIEEFTEYNAMPKYVVSSTLSDADLVSGLGRHHDPALTGRRRRRQARQTVARSSSTAVPS